MKVRKDFVTNSSSSSYIAVFARIADPDKAAPILAEFEGDIEVMTAQEVLDELQGNGRWGCNMFSCVWACVDVAPHSQYVKEHMDSKFVFADAREDLCEIDDGDYPDYDFVDYDEMDTPAIDAISEEHGFADIDCQCGAGRDG